MSERDIECAKFWSARMHDFLCSEGVLALPEDFCHLLVQYDICYRELLRDKLATA